MVTGQKRWVSGLGVGMTIVSLMGAAVIADSLPTRTDWPMFGQNIFNTGSNTGENGIGPKNVAGLKMKWAFNTSGDVSARAAVVDGVAYFPDWGGNLYALNAGNGKLVWSHQLSDYGLTGSFDVHYHARTSPAVVNGVVYIGSQEGAYLLAIPAATGNLLWKTQLRSAGEDPYAMVTSSPVVNDNIVYTGVASNEEGYAGIVPGFVCCHARGSVVAVDAATGQVIWETYTVPVGYTGGGAWGSNFVVDPTPGTLFASTGNNYSESTDPAYVACITGGGSKSTCASPDNHVDSVLALDLATGAIKWSRKLVTWNQPFLAIDGSDDWNVDCFIFQNGNCPANAGPDYDFASAPNLITYKKGNTTKTILGAGQKSGIYYALNPDTGAVLWQTQVGPGSSLGGMEWGSATDGTRIYVSIANLYAIPSAAGSAGSWAALDPDTGSILWQKADPNGAVTLGPVTPANGLVYVSSMAGAASAPTMLALDGATGQTLWSFAAGASVNAGAVVANGVVYWGSGYAHLGIPGYTGFPSLTGDVAPTRFYAFSNK